MKHGKRTMALLLVLLAVLTGCSAPASGSTAPEPSSQAPAPSVQTAPRSVSIEMLVQNYENGNIIEIPQLVAEGSAVVDEINRSIQEFAEAHTEFLGGHPEEYNCEIKAYPFLDEKYAQIIMTRIFYPTYGTDGDVLGFVYDIERDELVEETEAMVAELTSPNTLRESLVHWARARGEFQPEEQKTFEVKAYLFTEEGVRYIFEVDIESIGGSDWKRIYYSRPETGRFYHYDQLLFEPGEPMAMEPPLSYDRVELPDPAGVWLCDGIDTDEDRGLMRLQPDGSLELELYDVDIGRAMTGRWETYATTLDLFIDGWDPAHGSVHGMGINALVSLEGSFYYFRPLAKTATLYADLSSGNPEFPELIQQHEYSYSGELTAELLAQGLSELTGLDFFITASETDDGIAVDWADNSTLIANLDEREQKQEFFFFDSDSLRWFMMDSLLLTLRENLGVENVYYTMQGGSDLVIEQLYLVDHFPADLPFMGYAFYLGHDDVRGGIDEAQAFELVRDAINLRGEDAPVIVAKGEEVIGGEDCRIFAAGSNSADGLKFTAMYHYAVSASGRVYYMDVLQGADWLALDGEEPELTGEMSRLAVAFADAFFGGIQDPPALQGVTEDGLLCLFTVAGGETVGLEFGRDASVTPEEQVYFLDVSGSDTVRYRVLFDGGDVRLEDESGAVLTAAQFAAR